jgi:Short repeat of unknown function (DUF308)
MICYRPGGGERRVATTINRRALMSGNPVVKPSAGLSYSHVRSKWGWFVALGVALVLLGFLALGDVVAVTPASAVFVGAMFLVGGIFHLIHAFMVKTWSGFLMNVLAGVVYASSPSNAAKPHAERVTPGGIPPSRRRHTRRPLRQHEPRRLQVLYKPLSSDPRHRIVSVIHPLSTLVAERERQSLGDLICGGKAKGRGVGHTPGGSRLKKPVPSRHQVRPRLIQVDDVVETSPTHPGRTAQTALLVKVRCPPGGFQCPPIVAWCSCLTAARLP